MNNRDHLINQLFAHIGYCSGIIYGLEVIADKKDHEYYLEVKTKTDELIKLNEIDTDNYHKVIQFLKSLSYRSCCNVCECVSCDATEMLRKLGEI